MRNPLVSLGVLTLVGGGLWLSQAEPAPQGKGPPPSNPAIPAPGVTPNLATVNTSVTLTATVSIPDPTLDPSSVELLRVNADGSISVVTNMRDNGQGGDQKPGDKTFTAMFTINEAHASVFGFQVRAAFRGQSPTLSSIQQFPVLAPHIFPVVLPPDPGLAGKQTLQGIDSDGDGVRDDIQRWIVFTEPASDRMRHALGQQAQAIQGIITTQSSSSFDASDVAGTCLFGVGDTLQISPDDLAKLSKTLMAQFLNTPARSNAFLSANYSSNGRTGRPIKLSDRISACAFDPSSLEN